MHNCPTCQYSGEQFIMPITGNVVQAWLFNGVCASCGLMPIAAQPYEMPSPEPVDVSSLIGYAVKREVERQLTPQTVAKKLIDMPQAFRNQVRVLMDQLDEAGVGAEVTRSKPSLTPK